MANKNLKSIKFPGLTDTYVVPQVDTTLTQAGRPADAKKTGDEISALKEDLSDVNAELADVRVGADGTTYASAGAAVREQINKVNNKIDDVENLTIKSETVTETNSIKSELTWTDGYYMTINGTALANGAYSYSSLIDVVEGDILSIPSTYGYFRFVTAYANGSAVSAKGIDESAKTYTVPSDITGVIVTLEKQHAQSASVDIKLTHTEIIKSNILDADIEQIQSDIEALQNIKPDDIDGISLIGGDVFDDVVETHNGTYISASGGKIKYSSNSVYNSIVVPLQAKKYNKTGNASAFRFVHFLQEDKSTVIGSAINNTKIIDNTEVNAPYCAISYYAEDSNAGLVAENEPSDKTYHVTGKYQFEDLEIDSNTVIHAYLPPEICVGVGRTIELYNNLICLEADKYHLYWSCSVGVAYKRKFSITGTDNNIGTYSLTLRIYDDNLNIVKTMTSTVKIVANELTDTVKVVPIGDSLTNQKAWETEVQTLADGKIAYIGTRKGPYARYKHEGRSGATAAWYNANSSYTYDSDYAGNPEVDGTKNPFWDGSKFSLAHYIETQADTIGTPNAVQLLLGTNGMAIDPTTNVNNIKAIVDSIKNEYPNMPIFVCNTIYRSNQDGYHSTGGDGYVAVSGFQFNEDVKVMNLQNALAEALNGYTNVYIVPLAVCMDRDNNFGQDEVAVNPRLTTVTTKIAHESVHPQNAGYLQMADVMYSSYIAHLS